ncbi:hypothetical protein N7478_011444 [Penicillium angulare]|uniref:uncharacterized protein n=1 Tax=Penicillium angulare TaxID=116970 RepID=UPI002541EE04|nr:uncharacterized protein N7478_011444 [Penicillium angulare]KAJ5263839.1 hypothetical protein N7478_011444 [Penicillium angulare]
MHSSSANIHKPLLSQEGCSPDSSQIDLTSGRRFHPENVYSQQFSQEEIECPNGDLVYLACPGSKERCRGCGIIADSFHADCLIIAIDGACSNNGKDEARSSIGVFHGYDNDLNLSRTLDGFDRHTNQIAELEACLAALIAAIRIQTEWSQAGDLLDAIVIKSDSEYVVRGLTEWLPKWKGNGWKNAKGLPVANSDQFKKIELLIDYLERYISVKFWIVPREQNKMADSLAKAALK